MGAEQDIAAPSILTLVFCQVMQCCDHHTHVDLLVYAMHSACVLLREYISVGISDLPQG